MPGSIRIGLVGEYSPTVKAHRAIPIALEMAARKAGCGVDTQWLPTKSLNDNIDQVEQFDGLWVVPASPYASMDGALKAIKFARETGMPFLGTCGGFQHALIEYARNVLGIKDADHAESNPDASVLFVTPLICELRDVKGEITLKRGSKIIRIYGKDVVLEEYNCGFGLNPEYRAMLENAGMEPTGFDIEGDARVLELPAHPFYIGTLYQPERSALAGEGHPLISAYVQAVFDAQNAGGRYD